MHYPRIILKKGKDQSILRKHPWVFSGAIDLADEEMTDGDLVAVHDCKHALLGVGHFQHATIAVRMLSYNEQLIDTNFFKHKIGCAFELRLSLGLVSSKNTIFRLCHGEGDDLPGLIIDYYAGVAVVQCHSIGMYRQLKEIKEALIAVLAKKLKAIY